MSFRCDWGGGKRKENKFSTYTNTQCHIHLSHSEFFHRHISCWLLPIMMMMIANQMWKTFPISDNELLLKIKNNTVNLCGPCMCVCFFFDFYIRICFFFIFRYPVWLVFFIIDYMSLSCIFISGEIWCCWWWFWWKHVMIIE